MTKPVTKPVTKSVTILDRNTKNGQCVVEAVVSVSITVSAESIGQLEFRFRYRTETKIVVSVVHYLKQTFPPIIWIFTEVEGDGIESRLPFKIFPL